MNPVTIETMLERDVTNLKPVTNDQVLKCRLPFHAGCSGTGVLHRLRPVAEQELCECAQKRFKIKHAKLIYFGEGGSMFWLPSSEAR